MPELLAHRDYFDMHWPLYLKPQSCLILASTNVAIYIYEWQKIRQKHSRSILKNQNNKVKRVWKLGRDILKSTSLSMRKLRKESVKFLCGRAEAQTRNQQKNLRSEFKIALRRCCKRRIGANPQIHIRWADREDSKLNPLSKHWLGAEYLFKLEMWDNKVAQFCISFSFISNTETNNIL